MLAFLPARVAADRDVGLVVALDQRPPRAAPALNHYLILVGFFLERVDSIEPLGIGDTLNLRNAERFRFWIH